MLILCGLQTSNQTTSALPQTARWSCLTLDSALLFKVALHQLRCTRWLATRVVCGTWPQKLLSRSHTARAQMCTALESWFGKWLEIGLLSTDSIVESSPSKLSRLVCDPSWTSNGPRSSPVSWLSAGILILCKDPLSRNWLRTSRNWLNLDHHPESLDRNFMLCIDGCL